MKLYDVHVAKAMRYEEKSQRHATEPSGKELEEAHRPDSIRVRSNLHRGERDRQARRRGCRQASRWRNKFELSSKKAVSTAEMKKLAESLNIGSWRQAPRRRTTREKLLT